MKYTNCVPNKQWENYKRRIIPSDEEQWQSIILATLEVSKICSIL